MVYDINNKKATTVTITTTTRITNRQAKPKKKPKTKIQEKKNECSFGTSISLPEPKSSNKRIFSVFRIIL